MTHKEKLAARIRGRNAKTPLLVAVISGLALAGALIAPTASSVEVDPSEGVDVDASVAGVDVEASVGGEAPRARVPVTDNADLHCFGSFVFFFKPGLTEEPSAQTITGWDNLGTELSPTTPCSSATGIPYKGGTMQITKASGELACTAARGTLGHMEGTAEMIWDNGDESTIEFNAVSYGALPVLEFKFTDGELKGSTAYQELVPTSITGNCVESPVTSLGASGVMTIVNESG